MNKLKNFSNQKMSWIKVIILAIGAAVLTAVLKIIPIFENTSFQDIAINLECWILFAVFIVVNCEKWYEASLKTFVFFLISQPLIYLIQVPFSSLKFGIFQYYKYWFIITVLTIPGAAIAYLVKKKNWLSVAVLSVATGFLGYMTADYFWSVTSEFPYHLLSMCFCVVLAIFLIFALFYNKMHRIVSIGITVIVMAVSLFVIKPTTSITIELEEGKWTYVIDDPEIARIEIEEDNSVVFKAKKNGNTLVTFTNEDGEIAEYWVTVSGGGVYINTFD